MSLVVMSLMLCHMNNDDIVWNPKWAILWDSKVTTLRDYMRQEWMDYAKMMNAT